MNRKSPRILSALLVSVVLLVGSALVFVNSRNAEVSSVTTSSTVPSTTTVPVTQKNYIVGDVGSVVLDAGGEMLSVVSVSPTFGWIALNITNVDASNVLVQFQSGTTVVDFTATRVGADVTTSTTTKDLSIPVVQPVPATIPITAPRVHEEDDDE